MSGKKSKEKGNRFERKICRILTKWVIGKEDPVVFWRTGGSGSQFVAKEGESPMCGDIMAIDPIAEPFTNYFCIECKNWKKAGIWNSLESSGDLKDWWVDLEEKAFLARKNPLLIFQEFRSIPLVLLSKESFEEIREWNSSPPDFFELKTSWCKGCLLSLRKFLEWVSIETFKALKERK